MNERVVGTHPALAVPYGTEPGARVLGYADLANGTKQEVVSAKAAVADTSEFGVIDAVDPGARLRVLIETAQTYRAANPKAPKRAAELAVDEVLRLRKELDVQRRIRKSFGWILVDNAELIEEQHQALERLSAFIKRPLWVHAVERFIALFD